MDHMMLARHYMFQYAKSPKVITVASLSALVTCAFALTMTLGYMPNTRDTNGAARVTRLSGGSVGWTDLGDKGRNQSKTSGSTVSVSPTSNLSANTVVIAACVSKPVSDTNGQTTDHGVTDSDGNGWTRLREHTRVEGLGEVTGSLWVTQLGYELSTSDSVTLTVANTVEAKAIGLHAFSLPTGYGWNQAGGNSADGDSNSASVMLSNLANAEHLWIGMTCIGYTIASSGTDPDYDIWGVVNTTGDPLSSNVIGGPADRVYTGTSDTFSEDYTDACAWVALLVALDEVSGALPNRARKRSR